MVCFQPGPLFPGNERTIFTPSDACNSTAEPISATSERGTKDNLFILPQPPPVAVHERDRVPSYLEIVVARRFTMSATRSASAAAMVPLPGAILFIT